MGMDPAPRKLSQVWGKFSPEALGHHLLLPPSFLGFINMRSLSRCCGLPSLTLGRSRASPQLHLPRGWLRFTCSQENARHDIPPSTALAAMLAKASAPLQKCPLHDFSGPGGGFC